MKHLFKSTKSAIALLLAAAFVCGGAAALTCMEDTSSTAKQLCSQSVNSGIMLADDWDCSNFI